MNTNTSLIHDRTPLPGSPEGANENAAAPATNAPNGTNGADVLPPGLPRKHGRPRGSKGRAPRQEAWCFTVRSTMNMQERVEEIAERLGLSVGTVKSVSFARGLDVLDREGVMPRQRVRRASQPVAGAREEVEP